MLLWWMTRLDPQLCGVNNTLYKESSVCEAKEGKVLITHSASGGKVIEFVGPLINNNIQ